MKTYLATLGIAITADCPEDVIDAFAELVLSGELTFDYLWDNLEVEEMDEEDLKLW